MRIDEAENAILGQRHALPRRRDKMVTDITRCAERERRGRGRDGVEIEVAFGQHREAIDQGR
jgi:hypothetical protein